VSNDVWGQPIAGSLESVVSWNQAWDQFLHFRDDAYAELAAANPLDEAFVMGGVFNSVYSILGGLRFDERDLVAEVDRVRSRAPSSPAREKAHAEALDVLFAGNFSRAATMWDEIAAEAPDFAAIRFAHDIYLHVGDTDARMASSLAAVDQWGDRHGANFVASQHSFALEETGQFAEAERVGRAALEADPDDLWARHALVHVYEHTNNPVAAFEILEGSDHNWPEQDQLSTHIWWHVALFHLAAGEIDRVLAIFDDRLVSKPTAFRLCDQTSLLWRAELAGFDVGSRWDGVADRWDESEQRHNCGFLDLHAAFSFAKRPDHPGAKRWLGGLADRPLGDSENDIIFQDVVAPLVVAAGAFAAGDTSSFAHVVADLGQDACRIGGSNAQREIITLTANRTDLTP